MKTIPSAVAVLAVGFVWAIGCGGGPKRGFDDSTSSSPTDPAEAGTSSGDDPGGFGNKEAGARLNAMLELGQSRPWQDALEKIAGTRQMDATAIRDYFAPLQKWLDEQNQGKPVGW